MSDNDFDTPDEIVKDDTEYFDAKNEIGKLVLFSPFEYVEKTSTIHGEKDAVKTHTVVFDEDGTAREYPDSKVFSGSLIAKLKPYAKRGSGRVLCRLEKGVAKKGMAAPYVLEVPTDAEKQMARDWITKAADPLAL